MRWTTPQMRNCVWQLQKKRKYDGDYRITKSKQHSQCRRKLSYWDQGHVVGIGTHQELINTCPIYKKICLSQMREGDRNKTVSKGV